MDRKKLTGVHAAKTGRERSDSSGARCARSGEFGRVLLLLLGLTGSAFLAPAQIQAQAQEASTMKLSAVQAEVVDINTADANTIASTLKGVGQSKAEAIVRYREQFGPFESVEELTEVRGIGEATLEHNRPRIKLQ